MKNMIRLLFDWKTRPKNKCHFILRGNSWLIYELVPIAKFHLGHVYAINTEYPSWMPCAASAICSKNYFIFMFSWKAINKWIWRHLSCRYRYAQHRNRFCHQCTIAEISRSLTRTARESACAAPPIRIRINGIYVCITKCTYEHTRVYIATTLWQFENRSEDQCAGCVCV